MQVWSINYALLCRHDVKIQEHLCWNLFSNGIILRLISTVCYCFSFISWSVILWGGSVNYKRHYWHSQKLRQYSHLRDFSILESSVPTLQYFFFHECVNCASLICILHILFSTSSICGQCLHYWIFSTVIYRHINFNC